MAGKKMTEERKAYLKEYKKEKLKRVPLDLDLETFERFKAATKAAHKSVNGVLRDFVKRYVDASGY